MLILTRNPQQSIKLGDTIEVKVLAINGNQVRIGLEAPKTVTILREELKNRELCAAASPLKQVLQKF